MTPEDDVNNDTDQESTEKSEVDQSADSIESASEAAPEAATPEATSKPTESNASQADFADKAADALRDLNAVKDDIDVAANAQAEGEKVDSAAAAATEEDPLGFLDKNEDGSVVNPDGDEVESLRTQLSEATAKVSAQQEQLLRVQAEMENQRKRAQNDVTKAHKFALEKIALDLLPVKDSLEMGLQAATVEDAELTKIIEGSELTLKMLAQVLEKYNIVEVNPVDEKFDPEFHQAMSMQPVEGKEPNTVASVMQKGYTLNERLIRPALVMVAK